MYEIVEGGFRVRLDREPQRLRLRVEESDHFLFDQPLPGEGHVCAGELMYRAKEIDDGVVAALQLAAQRGVGKLPAKARMLATLADETRDPLLGAACILGGIKKPGGLFSRKLPGEDEAKALLEDEGKTKPLGFYTWSDSLRRLFRQDRALQDELPSPQRVREVLRADPDLMRAYEAHLAFEARVANPPAEPDLRTGERLLPAARAPERTLILALYGNSPIPDGFDLMSELVRRSPTRAAPRPALAPPERPAVVRRKLGETPRVSRASGVGAGPRDADQVARRGDGRCSAAAAAAGPSPPGAARRAAAGILRAARGQLPVPARSHG